MSGERSWDGWWWVPDKHEERLAGHLRWTPIEGAELDLFGDDPALFGRSPEQGPDLRSLHGHSLEGKALTLLEPFMRREGFNMAGGLWEHWAAPTLIVGEHVSSRDAITFTEARVSLRGLGKMLDRSLPSAGEFADGASATASIDGGSVTVKFAPWEIRGHRRRCQEMRPELRLWSERPFSLEQWRRKVVRPLINLVLLSTGEQCYVEDFVVFVDHPVDPPLAPDGSRIRHEVELLDQRMPAGRRGGRTHGGRLLPRDCMTDELLQAWLELNLRLDPAVHFLFGTLNADSTFLENRLVSLTSYVEAYHRRVHGPHGSLKERLQALVDRARPVVPRLDPFADHLADQIVASRARIVHDRPKSAALEGPQLSHALSRLVLVLLTNLLVDLRLPADAITETVRESYATNSALSEP